MRLVDVNGFYAPLGGGVRSYVDWKLRHAEQSAHEVIIIAPGPEDRCELRRGGAIQWVASPQFPLDRRYRMLMNARRTHELLDQLRPDVIEASSPWRTAGIVAEWRGDAPKHWIMHADPLAAYAYRWFGALAQRSTIDQMFGWFWDYMRSLAPRFARIVCANEWLAARLRGGGIANVDTIPFGVEAGIFTPLRRDADLRATLLKSCDRPESGLLLCGVGRHTPEKMWPLVIEAAAAAGARRDIALIQIGEGRDTHVLTRTIGSNPHIRLLPPIRDRQQLATLLASTDGLIHGCDAETFCFVAAEAAASGIPVIAPSEGAAKDAAKGFVSQYRAGDVVDATRAILDLHDCHDQALAEAREHARAAPRTMDDHFNDLFAAYGAPARRAA